MSLKNPNDTIGDRTRNLPVCSTVPEPLRAPNMATVEYQKLWYMLSDKYKWWYKINASYFFLVNVVLGRFSCLTHWKVTLSRSTNFTGAPVTHTCSTWRQQPEYKNTHTVDVRTRQTGFLTAEGSSLTETYRRLRSASGEVPHVRSDAVSVICKSSDKDTDYRPCSDRPATAAMAESKVKVDLLIWDDHIMVSELCASAVTGKPAVLATIIKLGCIRLEALQWPTSHRSNGRVKSQSWFAHLGWPHHGERTVCFSSDWKTGSFGYHHKAWLYKITGPAVTDRPQQQRQSQKSKLMCSFGMPTSWWANRVLQQGLENRQFWLPS